MPSFIPDNSDMLATLRQTFGTPESREKARKEKELIAQQQKDIDILTGQPEIGNIVIDESGATGAPSAEEQEAALVRIAALNPQMANAIRGSLERGDKLELEATARETRKGVEQALLIKNQQSFQGKRAALTQLAQQASANGENIDRFVELTNMSEEQLDLELDKMLLQGADIEALAGSALKAEEGFTLSEGQVRFGPGGKEIARVAPKKEQETNLVRNLRAAGIDPGSDEGKQIIKTSLTKPNTKIDINEGLDFKIPEGFMLLDENDPTKGVTPIPGGPKDTVAAEAAAKTQMLRTAQEAAGGIRNLVFDKDDSINRTNVFNASFNTPFTDGRKLRQQMEFGIQAITRAETGAAMPPGEVENTRERFMPKIGDTTEMVDTKLKMYDMFINGSLQLLDPSGRFDTERFDSELNARIGVPQEIGRFQVEIVE